MLRPSVYLHSLFVLVVSSLVLVSCGSDQRGKSKSQSDSPFLSGGGDARNQIQYCDDQNRTRTSYVQNPRTQQRRPQVKNQNNRQGVPYQYPGQRTCMRGPDGEPIVDVRPGANPGQRRDYRTPRNYNDPKWQNPRQYPNQPNQPRNPQWQNPRQYPNQPNQPRNPQWQQPRNPNNNRNTPNNPNNPNWQQPNYNPEPLPY